MKIAILGTRGVPAQYGGFETFAEELGKRMVEKNVETLVVGDGGLDYSNTYFNGIKVVKTKTRKPENPLKFYRESLRIAKNWQADFVLVCGVGSSMFIPFYKKYFPIAVNPDGLGFKRDKYNLIQKLLFYSQYVVANITFDYMVCDSYGIKEYYEKKLFRRKRMTVIEYGTYINPFLEKIFTKEDFSHYDLPFLPRQYHLVVSRLEPENNVKMIIEGYLKSEAKYPLIIVGNTNTPHSKELLKLKSDKVYFIGGIYEKEKLQLLRAGSYSYWHGHSVGGTNPSLLEAMGSANLCVCHDNNFNRELVQDNGFYFSSWDNARKIFNQIEDGLFSNFENGVLQRAKERYNWELITNKYISYASEIINKSK